MDGSVLRHSIPPCGTSSDTWRDGPPESTSPYADTSGVPDTGLRASLKRMAYLWRAVDAEGEVLDVLVQSKRNKHAALKLMRKPLKKCAFVPERLVTDDLRSYGAAARALGIEHLHERGQWRNNWAKTFVGSGEIISIHRELCRGDNRRS
jgi:hypothetical protein